MTGPGTKWWRTVPDGALGTKSTVLVLALRFSPVPSIQMYMHWVFFEAVMSNFMNLDKRLTGRGNWFVRQSQQGQLYDKGFNCGGNHDRCYVTTTKKTFQQQSHKRFLRPLANDNSNTSIMTTIDCVLDNSVLMTATCLVTSCPR